MSYDDFFHIPVLLTETLRFLSISPEKIYLDATAGGGGHTIFILKKLTTGKIYAFDKDPDAINRLKGKLNLGKLILINDSFSNMENYVQKESVDGIVMDLGVSSFQLDNEKRGFSYLKNGPLDMRMSKKGPSAKEFINTASEKKIFRILKCYGEEKFASKIAKNIVVEREKKTIETTKELSNIIIKSIPAKFKRNKNPCKKTFQAIRIEVNKELIELENGLKAAFKLLKTNGVLVVISFHSLEDKMVKNFFKEKSTGCVCPKNFPLCICGKKPVAQIITKKPVVPSAEEIFNNRRARSAKLRALKKLSTNNIMQ